MPDLIWTYQSLAQIFVPEVREERQPLSLAGVGGTGGMGERSENQELLAAMVLAMWIKLICRRQDLRQQHRDKQK